MKRKKKGKVDHKSGILTLAVTLLCFLGIPLVLYLCSTDTYGIGGYAATCIVIGTVVWFVKQIFCGFIKS